MNKEVKLKYVLIIVLFTLILGFFLGQEITSSRISKVVQKTTKNTDLSSTSNENKNLIQKNLGDVVELATLNLVVNSSNEVINIPQSYGSPIVPSQGAKLVIINMTITNTSNSEFTLGSDWITIINQEEKSFSEHADAYNLDNYINWETLKPDIAFTGDILFEVSESSKELYLLVSKAGTSDTYKIALINN